METSVNSFPRFERSGFASAAIGACAVLFLIGIAPRSERALFLKDDSRPPAKAFSAVVPPLDATRSQTERSLLNTASGSRSSRSGGSQTNPAAPQFVASNQPLLPGTLPTLLSTGGAPGADAPAADTTPPSGAPPAPTGGQQPAATTPTTGNPAAAPGLPAPTAGAPATDEPVTAVPEPATWAMMLLGFLAIGAMTRRRPARAGSAIRA
ncbi:MAG: hypothetical protein JWR80_305 [Bradyrhizobium sp.]|nr:hypothetical protein [Bradyrhizobium sp.]